MEVEIKFEPSGRNGVVAVGSYLLDAAKRLGIKLEDEFGEDGLTDACFVKIIKGGDLLSKPTKVELEHLSQQGRTKDERLPSQAKIEKPGELVVMVAEKKKPEESKFEEFRKEFDQLPLDEKVKNLLELETAALSETLSYIMNLPYTIGAKIRDGMAEFGFKMEEDAKKARRPEEHKEEEKKSDSTASTEGNTEEPVAADYSDEQNAAPKKAAPRPKRTPKTENKSNGSNS